MSVGRISKKPLAMDNDNELLRYTIKDNLCAKAIEEFMDTSSVRDWLQENRLLYDSVSYQSPGLPRIVASNLGQEVFENILNFGRLYVALDIGYNEKKSKSS